MFRYILFTVVAFFISGAFKEVAKQELVHTTIVKNGGFENGLAGWTKTGSSTFAITSSGIKGSSLIVDYSASGEYALSSQFTIPTELKGKRCLASFEYLMPTDASGSIKWTVVDGSSVAQFEAIDLSQTESNISVVTQAAFVCPTTGTVGFRLESTANTASDFQIDKFYLGSDYRVGSSQEAEHLGKITWGSTNCTWDGTSAVWTDYAPDADCTAVVTGSVSEPATKIPAVKVSSVKAGTYKITARAQFLENQSSAHCVWSFYDGANYDGRVETHQGGSESANNLIGSFTYTSDQGDKEFTIRYDTNGASCVIDADAAQTSQYLYIDVEYFPLNPTSTATLDTQGMIFSGYHDDECQMGTTNDASFELVAGDATCGFVERVNENFGAVASIADGTGNQLGLEFTPRKLGAYFVCASTPIRSATGGVCGTSLQFNDVEISDAQNTDSSGYSSAAMCGVFSVATLSLSTLKVKQMTNSSGNSCILTGSDSVDGSTVNWSIFPITQQLPQTIALPDTNTVGDIKTSIAASIVGWIRADGNSIGKTGADYNGDLYRNLYDLLWNMDGLSTTTGHPFVISSTKGANPQADWDAGKTITLDFAANEVFVRAKSSSRTLGSFEDQATKRPSTNFTGSTNSDTHSHDEYAATDSSGTTNQVDRDASSSSGTTLTNTNTGSDTHSHTVTITGGGDAETRPKNVSLYYFIKY